MALDGESLNHAVAIFLQQPNQKPQPRRPRTEIQARRAFADFVFFVLRRSIFALNCLADRVNMDRIKKPKQARKDWLGFVRAFVNLNDYSFYLA
jgi:hypothetical protein